jgi:hypothetical protein
VTSPIDRTAAGISTATRAVEDVFYVSVGAGVLAVQSAQVRRRELRDRLTEQIEDAQQALDRLRAGADDGLRIVGHQVDEVIGHVEERLPGGARELLGRGRAVGADARQSVHQALRPPVSSTAET